MLNSVCFVKHVVMNMLESIGICYIQCLGLTRFWWLMHLFVYPGTIPGFCAMCELQAHIGKVFGPSGVALRPAQIVQNLKSESCGSQHACMVVIDTHRSRYL